MKVSRLSDALPPPAAIGSKENDPEIVSLADHSKNALVVHLYIIDDTFKIVCYYSATTNRD